VADKYKGVILNKEIHKNVIKDIFVHLLIATSLLVV
jgi:hypothetical protein